MRYCNPARHCVFWNLVPCRDGAGYGIEEDQFDVDCVRDHIVNASDITFSLWVEFRANSRLNRGADTCSNLWNSFGLLDSVSDFRSCRIADRISVPKAMISTQYLGLEHSDG